MRMRGIGFLRAEELLPGLARNGRSGRGIKHGRSLCGGIAAKPCASLSGGLIRTVVAESPEDLFWSWLTMWLLQPLVVISSGSLTAKALASPRTLPVHLRAAARGTLVQSREEVAKRF